MAKKRPDLNELDAPEWAELALDKVERVHGALLEGSRRLRAPDG
jgi:hypothetical protein